MALHKFPPGQPDPTVLKKFGPRLEIEVRPPIIRNRKDPRYPVYSNPASEKVSRMPALIDTGASRTVLTPEAIAKVGLQLVEYAILSGAGGEDKVGAHVASIHFPRYRLATIELIQVLCCELPHQPVQCLIGRDILSRWIYTHNGRTGEWSIDEEELAAWVEPPEGLLT